MNVAVSSLSHAAKSQSIDAGPDPAIMRARSVHRAASEMRRGVPVLMDGWLLLAAETAGAGGIAESAAAAGDAPVLLLSPVRAASVLHRPVEGDGVVALHTAVLEEASLRGLADPTAAQVCPEPPVLASGVPPVAAASLALAKLARLLPAVLAAPVRPGAGTAAFLSVPASTVLAHPAAQAGALRRVAETPVPLEDAPNARVVAFRAPDTGVEHLAIVIGDPLSVSAPLVRIHSECFTGDLLGSLRCDCGPQLRRAIRQIAEAEHGAVLYLAQEGRGIGLVNKLRAYALQDRGLDTLDANRALGWDADERDFSPAATMLAELGIGRVRLLTNNPAKVDALAACGVEIAAREPLVIPPNGVDNHYLATKARRFGHML